MMSPATSSSKLKLDSSAPQPFHRLVRATSGLVMRRTIALVLLTFVVSLALAGCGAGGYIGGGISSLSTSSLVLDAGQSTAITAKLSGAVSVAWTLPQQSCGGSCGTLSAATGATITYTAPSGIASPMQL